MTASSLINNYQEIYKQGFESLVKAEALIDFALQSDASEIPSKTLHGYLWIVNDLLNQVKFNYDKLGRLVDMQPDANEIDGA